MKQRTITAVIMFVVLVPLLYLGGWFFTCLGMVLSYIAGYELLKMMEKEDRTFKRLKYVVPLYNALLVLIFKLDQSLVVPLVILTILSFLALGIFRPKFSIKSTISLIFVYLYSGLLLGLTLSLRLLSHYALYETGYTEFLNRGFYLFVYLLITVMFTDMGAYFIGCSIGKHKLCPTISPKKSVEGAIGGIVIGTLFGFLFYFLVNKYVVSFSFFGFDTKYEWLIVLIVTILLTVATEIGDLVASKLKRHYDIKDYGNLFPGHGGVMDRFDSLIFAGALLYALLIYLV